LVRPNGRERAHQSTLAKGRPFCFQFVKDKIMRRQRVAPPPCHPPKNGAQSGESAGTVVLNHLLKRPMMKKLSLVGIIAGAALSTATPVSLHWTPQRVALSVDQADAQTRAGVQRRVYRRAYRQPYYPYAPYSGYWTYPFFGYGLFPYRYPADSPFR
jgi:hypothetical protein